MLRQPLTEHGVASRGSNGRARRFRTSLARVTGFALDINWVGVTAAEIQNPRESQSIKEERNGSVTH